MTDKCSVCGAEPQTILYMGFPMYLCESDEAAHPEAPVVYGFWSWIPEVWFNGVFVLYTGSYWRALWSFIRGDRGS